MHAAIGVAGMLVGLAGFLAPANIEPTSPSSELEVYLSCAWGSCEAIASGGSGGYSFEWSGTIDGGYTYGDQSWASPDCSSEIREWVSVYVRVIDSSGARVRAGAFYGC